MGRSRSRSRERRREEKRGRPSDDYPSSRDYDRVEGSRRTFPYLCHPSLSPYLVQISADKRARETELSVSCLIKETKLLLIMVLLRIFFDVHVYMYVWMDG